MFVTNIYDSLLNRDFFSIQILFDAEEINGGKKCTASISNWICHEHSPIILTDITHNELSDHDKDARTTHEYNS